MKGEHDFNNYIMTLDSLLPGIALSAVLPAWIRYWNQLVGLLLPSIRESVYNFNKIRAAGKYWVEDRMVKMNNKEVNRTDLLDKMFRIRSEKENFGVLDIQTEACVAM